MRYFDPFGSYIPAIVVYAPLSAGACEITTITIPVAESLTRDYAKELLDRLRYLKGTYIKPYGPGSVLPAAQAFNDAESFILKLPLNRTGMPTINVASDGEVNFCWSNDQARIDLGFFGNGTYSFYGSSGGNEVVGEEVAADSPVPTDLLKIASLSA
jgi:hypothetical protein